MQYQKAITHFVYDPLCFNEKEKVKERQLRVSEILKINKDALQVNILVQSLGRSEIKQIVSGWSLSGPGKSLSPIIRDLLLRTSFSIEDTTFLLNFAMLVTGYESSENKGLFLNKLLKKFIHAHKEKKIDDKCRFIVLFTLLLHHRYLPKLYITDYIDSLCNNINDLFPTSIKPTQSHISHIDHLHSTEYEPTLLHYACKFKLFNLINLILEKDSISLSLNKQNHQGKTPIMLLCKYFHYDHFGIEDYLDSRYSLAKKIEIFTNIVDQCKKKDADLSIRDHKGKTIVHHIFENIFGKYDARHSLDRHIIEKLFSLLQFLDTHIPSWFTQTDDDGNTPFHILMKTITHAALSTQDQLILIYYFLNKKANVSEGNNNDQTPLQLYLSTFIDHRIKTYDIFLFLISQGSTIYWPNQPRKYKADLKEQRTISTPYKLIVEILSKSGCYGMRSALTQIIADFSSQKKELQRNNIEQYAEIINMIHNNQILKDYICNDRYTLQEKKKFFIETFIESSIKERKTVWEEFLGRYIDIDTETFKTKELATLTKIDRKYTKNVYPKIEFFFVKITYTFFKLLNSLFLFFSYIINKVLR